MNWNSLQNAFYIVVEYRGRHYKGIAIYDGIEVSSEQNLSKFAKSYD